MAIGGSRVAYRVPAFPEGAPAQVSTSSLDALAGALDAWHPDAVVSVHSPAWPVQPLLGVPHLRLSFNDAEWDGTTAFDGSLNRRGIEACTRFHVRRFLAFLHERAPQRLLVHCHAGLSQSPALAIVALVHAGMTIEAACQAVVQAVPEVSPNRRVVKCGNWELGLNGALVDAVVRTFDHRRGAHGAVGQATGHRIVEGTPPSRVLPGWADPIGHLGDRVARSQNNIRGSHA